MRRNIARRVPRWALWVGASLVATVAAKGLRGKQVPSLQRSFLRLLMGVRRLRSGWQMGDELEEALAAYVMAHARRGDVADVIRVIDEFCCHHSFMMNVGDEKGEILDAAVRRVQPGRLLELGTYCGYSALRMVRVMPSDAQLYSIEFSPANAEIAHRIWDHANGSLDFVFVDHDKAAYLPDLQRILSQNWLHPGSVVVADNVKFPGAPEYRAYLKGAGSRQLAHDGA